ncbi:MAG: hypothetical protein ACRDY3_04235, partial [Acidimicrobiales bacterium]
PGGRCTGAPGGPCTGPPGGPCTGAPGGHRTTDRLGDPRSGAGCRPRGTHPAGSDPPHAAGGGGP